MPAPAAAAALYLARTRTGRKVIVALLAFLLVLVLVIVVALSAFFADDSGTGGGEGGCVSGVSAPPPPGAAPGAAGDQQWDEEQRQNAQIIAATGQKMGVPPRGQWIALATAMQESTLRNLGGGDRDSAGLFQQRPSQGWGSLAQVQDPAYAATQFYDRLLALPGWAEMALTAAAQAVQRSAFPDAYAKWEQAATNLLAGVGEGIGNLVCTGETAVAGAAQGALDYARAQLGKPYEWGATGPDRFDCSGLTSQAWQAAGVQLPRTSRQQATAGQRVPQEQQQPGDLLFWSSNGSDSGIHHVALALGGGQIIEAPQTGVPVRIRQLGTPYDGKELLPYAVRAGTTSPRV